MSTQSATFERRPKGNAVDCKFAPLDWPVAEI